MAGRRTSLVTLAGKKVDDVPGQSDPLLLTLPLTVLVPTRFNPRRNFGTDEDLKAFGLVLKRRQLQPAVVVSRAAYLKLWPDEADAVGSAQYVIANGERRYRGSLAAELTTLNVVHNEDVAKTRADFLDAILSENNDREDLDPIERALGIETMVIQLGGADKVAAHYEKSKGWVSQQRKLLKLTPKLQDLVSAGDLPIRVGRDIAGLPQEEQEAAWRQEVSQRADAKAARKDSVRAAPEPAPERSEERETRPPTPGPVGTAAPTTEASPQTADPVADRFTAVNQTEAQPASLADVTPATTPGASLPEPRRTQAPEPQAPDEPAGHPSSSTWQLPPGGGWETTFNAILAQMGEFDRHMLTKNLVKVMDEELGATPKRDAESSST